jgi:hypothetical protein
MSCKKKYCINPKIPIDDYCEEHRKNKSCLSKYSKNISLIQDIINKIKNPLFVYESNPFILLTGLINYSIIKKDIKYFLLFLYLHDEMKVINLRNYDGWFSNVTYEYAYEYYKFSILDLEHYKKYIRDKNDQKIYNYLLENLEMNNKYFLKRYSWLKLDKLRMFKIYCKTIGKISLIYYKTLEKIYKPDGPMYNIIKTRFESMCKTQIKNK